LHAQRAAIARLVLGSLAVSRLVSSFLVHVSATDTHLRRVRIMLLMARLATHAASADPIDALRAI
jgi:hypothetical protein